MVAARTPNISHAPTAVRSAQASTNSASTRPARAASRACKLGGAAAARSAARVVEDSRNGKSLLLPTPLLVGEAIAAIPRGHVMTVTQLRRALAERFNAESTCPLMTGMFAMILAGAVAEDLGQRRKPRWPIWRLVRDDGTLHRSGRSTRCIAPACCARKACAHASQRPLGRPRYAALLMPVGRPGPYTRPMAPTT